MAVALWIVSDGLRERIEPLLPKRQRRFRYPGRRALPDREALQRILSVLHTGPGSRGGTYRSSSASARVQPATGAWSAGSRRGADSQGALVDQRTLRGALSRIAFVAGSSGDEPSAGAVMFFTIAAHGRRVPPVTPASAVAGSGA